MSTYMSKWARLGWFLEICGPNFETKSVSLRLGSGQKLMIKTLSLILYTWPRHCRFYTTLDPRREINSIERFPDGKEKKPIVNHGRDRATVASLYFDSKKARILFFKKMRKKNSGSLKRMKTNVQFARLFAPRRRELYTTGDIQQSQLLQAYIHTYVFACPSSAWLISVISCSVSWDNFLQRLVFTNMTLPMGWTWYFGAYLVHRGEFGTIGVNFDPQGEYSPLCSPPPQGQGWTITTV
jgi:hypothetical protein